MVGIHCYIVHQFGAERVCGMHVLANDLVVERKDEGGVCRSERDNIGYDVEDVDGLSNELNRDVARWATGRLSGIVPRPIEDLRGIDGCTIQGAWRNMSKIRRVEIATSTRIAVCPVFLGAICRDYPRAAVAVFVVDGMID